MSHDDGKKVANPAPTPTPKVLAPEATITDVLGM